MEHIDRIIWKPIDWYPDSPDRYPDGLPPITPEMTVVDLRPDLRLRVTGFQMASDIHLMFFRPAEVWELDEWTETEEETEAWLPTHKITIPADKDSVLAFVDALLYVQRRTHEHDWEGPDDGLEGLEED